ncbi:MAG: Wzz/FepE/Etk N-terminal domain-containing protein [Candidatus Methylacidiphilales bacterium]|nr:Wzz/FepE/Etk N-terminal domain-containing protein [Candidatus Methylacidiphilales bacterium]
MDESGIDLRGIVGLLRRQLRLIAGTIAVIVVLAAIVVFSLTPTYTASTLVLVDPSNKNLLDPTAEMMGASSENARVDSEVEILRSDAVMLEVVRANNLIADAEFGVRLGMLQSVLAFLRLRDDAAPTGNEALQSVLQKLSRAVAVQRRGLTYLVSIQATSRDQEKAALLANEVARAYIDAQVRAKIDSALAARDILQGRMSDASQAIVQSEEAFDTFIDNNIDRIGADSGNQGVLELRSRLQAANADYDRAAGTVNTVEAGIASQSWATVATTLQSTALAELERQRQQVASSLAAAAQGSQQEVDLRAELTRIESGLADTARQESSAFRNQISASKELADNLRQELRSTILTSNLPADVLTGIYQMQQNSEIARNQYQTLLARVSDVEQQASLQVADSRVVSPALAPTNPSFPNPPLFLTLALLSAIALGVGLAFLYENYIGGFTTEGQVSAVLRLPVAAVIPKHRSGKNAPTGTEAGDSAANTLITAPLSVYAETVRRVRAEIDQALRRSEEAGTPPLPGQKAPGKVLMVSSAAPGEGKTTMALSIARAYAISGRSVLLIDADLRKPSIHRQMGVEASTGLLEHLMKPANDEGLSDILFTESETGLLALVGARRSDIPTDQVIASKAFDDLIHLARTHFEMVVIDTPPVGPVVDGLYLAKFADAIAFVVRWASTSQRDARDAAHSLEPAKRPGVPTLVILNQQEGSAASYRNKYAGYYNEAY